VTTAASLTLSTQRTSWFSRPWLSALFWVAAVIALAVMAYSGHVGWDSQVCWKTVQSLHNSSDPYAGGIASLQEFQKRLGPGSRVHPPLVYVYSPITLPMLRVAAMFPGWALAVLYAVAMAIGVLLQFWAGFQMASKKERRWLCLLMPAMLFFPGLITDDVILSGNVAYVLYGLILAAGVPGWKQGNWSWYFVAVLAASVFKAPFLALLAFPVLMDRRQWVPSVLTAATGVLLFAEQMRLWPHMFREYLMSIRLMFDVAHDFGFGPAGLLGRVLCYRGLPYSRATSILSVIFAGFVGVGLLILARRVRQDNLLRENWIPVALVGTLLLNPRIMKYDLAAMTIPMLLIGWRTLQFATRRSDEEEQQDDSGRNGQKLSVSTAIFVGAGCFLIPNVITVAGPSWFPVELMVVLAIFASGVWCLNRSIMGLHSAESISSDLVEESDEVLSAFATSAS